MNQRARHNILRSTLIAQMLLALASPAFSQQEDGSLDALWNEGGDSSKGQAKSSGTESRTSKPNTSTSIDTSPNFKVTTGGASEKSTTKPDFSTTASDTEVEAPVSTGTSAPLCTLDAFKGSDFVKSGGWPGIGPFNPTLRVPNELKDAQDNHLRLKVDDQKVTEAELCLVKQPNAQSNFINLEMTTDYFLEALGVKPGKISDFNKELEKNKAEVVKDDVKPLSLSAGKYQVSIAAPAEDDLQNMPQDKKEKIALLVKVSSRDASPDSIRSAATSSTDTTPDEPDQTPPTRVASAGTGSQALKTPVKISTPPVKPTTPPPAKPVTPPPAAATNSNDALKNQFADLLRKWQTIKKTAVRNRTTGELADVLALKALNTQLGAIKYLMSQHKYYEMTAKGVNVSRIQELTPGKKYACFAQVKEFRRFIDDTTGQVLKEGEDTYNVNYTIEKIDDKWFISDSAVINTPPKAR